MKNKKLLIACLLSASTLALCSCFGPGPNRQSQGSQESSIPDKKETITIQYQLSDDGTYYIVTGVKNSEGYKTSPQGALTIPAEYEGLPVNKIGDLAFESCGDMTSIALPDTIEEIGREAFKGCIRLSSFEMPTNLKSIGLGAFGDDRLTTVILKEGLERLDQAAFFANERLTSITIPNSVTYLGDEVFGNNFALETINIGSGLTSLPSSAFRNCSSLRSISIPDNITTLGEGCFASCTSLTDIDFGNGVTELGTSVFIDCSSLVTVTIPNNVVNFGNGTFYRCENLETVNIGDGVDYSRSENYSCFAECPKLANINVSSNNQTIKSIDGVLYSKDGNELIQYPAGKTNDVYIREGVKQIGYDAFSYNSVTTSITLSSTIWKIRGFNMCNALRVANLDSQLDCIEDYTFVNCPELLTVTLPKTLTYISGYSFQNCPKITTINYLGTVEEWEENILYCYGFQDSPVTQVTCTNGTTTLRTA